MSVSMRFRRMGGKNDPFFRLVVSDTRSPRDGRFIEEIGWYNPIKSENQYCLNKERIDHWLSKGVRVSETVKSVLKKNGIVSK